MPRIENNEVSNNFSLRNGGGITIDSSTAIITRCVIDGNQSQAGVSCIGSECTPQFFECEISNNRQGDGGGVEILGTSPQFRRCKIYNNYSFWKGGGFSIQGGQPLIEECYITGNTAKKHGGGGISFRGSDSPKIVNCIISDNYGYTGGGIYIISDASLNLVNCIISGNRAYIGGSGINFAESTNVKITSCTIVGNQNNVDSGAGLFFEDISSSDTEVTNCIISHNAPYGIYWKYTVDKDLSYNNVWGNTGGDYGSWATAGPGSISADPLFVDNGYWDPNDTPEDPADDFWVNGDYHLKSKSGRWDSNGEAWVYDDITSPCVDAGDPSIDWGEELYPHGTRLNMGAYGGTVEASMSSSIAGNIADFNNDNIVNLFDYAILAENWHVYKKLLREDINRDGVVDVSDLVRFAEQWLAKAHQAIYQNSLDTDPGWSMEGQWQFGQPLGEGGSSCGNPDPSGGYTGNNVSGVNLSGDYVSDIGGPYYLTAGPFDCSGYENTKIRFARWLNSDAPGYVRSTVEASNSGSNWNVIWEHEGPSDITDNQWQIVDYEIGNIADDQPTVCVRWGYEIHADRAYPYSGWNIDDVELWGSSILH